MVGNQIRMHYGRNLPNHTIDDNNMFGYIFVKQLDEYFYFAIMSHM